MPRFTGGRVIPRPCLFTRTFAAIAATMTIASPLLGGQSTAQQATSPRPFVARSDAVGTMPGPGCGNTKFLVSGGQSVGHSRSWIVVNAST
jgi:hypothetical protein